MAARESEATARTHWRGALALQFADTALGTVIAHRRHEGPLCIQRPFYPGDGACHVYLLHPPGGLAAGDELELDVSVEAAAAALLTTPAATKFYRSDGAPSAQRQTLRVVSGASLEWLPLDTILFGGSRALIETDVALEPGARFIGWEQLSLGRPLSGDRYATGMLEQHTRISVAGEPLLLESLRLAAGDRLLTAESGLASFGVCGVLYAYPANDPLLVSARARLGAATPSLERSTAQVLRCGATLLGELLVVRCLAREPEAMRTLFEALWCELRPSVIGRSPSIPRVWRT
jgi:urease accessory protein